MSVLFANTFFALMQINISETKMKQSANNEMILLYHQMKQKICKKKRRIELWQN